MGPTHGCSAPIRWMIAIPGLTCPEQGQVRPEQDVLSYSRPWGPGDGSPMWGLSPCTGPLKSGWPEAPNRPIAIHFFK